MSEEIAVQPPDDRHPRQCTAHRSNGKPCKRYAIVGHHVCTSHGGASPQVIKIAKERIGKLADSAVDVLEEALQGDDTAQGIKAAKIVLDRTGIGPKSTIEIAAPDEDQWRTADYLLDEESTRYWLFGKLAQMRRFAVIVANREEELKALKAEGRYQEAENLITDCFAKHGILDIRPEMLGVLEDIGITPEMVMAQGAFKSPRDVRHESIVAEPEQEPNPDEPTDDSARAAIAKHFLGRDVETPVATDEEPVTIELEPPVRGADTYTQPDSQPNPTGFRNLLGWRK